MKKIRLYPVKSKVIGCGKKFNFMHYIHELRFSIVNTHNSTTYIDQIFKNFNLNLSLKPEKSIDVNQEFSASFRDLKLGEFFDNFVFQFLFFSPVLFSISYSCYFVF